MLACVLLLMVGPAQAGPADEAAIAGVLHGMFDKPDMPLRVAPIVVVGNHAIADWVQGEMGGRALLRKTSAWTIVLCAGDGIKSDAALMQAGIAAEDAGQLAKALAAAEARLAPGEVALFSRFEGLVMMDSAGHHKR